MCSLLVPHLTSHMFCWELGVSFLVCLSRVFLWCSFHFPPGSHFYECCVYWPWWRAKHSLCVCVLLSLMVYSCFRPPWCFFWLSFWLRCTHPLDTCFSPFSFKLQVLCVSLVCTFPLVSAVFLWCALSGAFGHVYLVPRLGPMPSPCHIPFLRFMALPGPYMFPHYCKESVLLGACVVGGTFPGSAVVSHSLVPSSFWVSKPQQIFTSLPFKPQVKPCP